MRGDRRKTSVEWPAAVDDRPRLLVRLAEEEGNLRSTSAAELLAALTCDQRLDGTRLAAVIAAYRQSGCETITTADAGEDPPRAPRRGRPRRSRPRNALHAEIPIVNTPASKPSKRSPRVGTDQPAEDPARAAAGSATTSRATSPATRRSMQANRRRDIHPELAIRRLIHARGLRHRVDTRPVPAVRYTADMIFTRPRVAVFIDGCWWHGCADHYRPPASNAAYWAGKVTRNRKRNQLVAKALTAAGWTVLRLWEHETPESAARRIEAVVRSHSATTTTSLAQPVPPPDPEPSDLLASRGLIAAARVMGITSRRA